MQVALHFLFYCCCCLVDGFLLPMSDLLLKGPEAFLNQFSVSFLSFLFLLLNIYLILFFSLLFPLCTSYCPLNAHEKEFKYVLIACCVQEFYALI